MRYTQDEFCQVITKAKCCAADLGYSYVVHKRNGQDDKAVCEIARLMLLDHYIATTGDVEPVTVPAVYSSAIIDDTTAPEYGVFDADFLLDGISAGVTGNMYNQKFLNGPAQNVFQWDLNERLKERMDAFLTPITQDRVGGNFVISKHLGSSRNGTLIGVDLGVKNYVATGTPYGASLLGDLPPNPGDPATNWHQSRSSIWQDWITGNLVVAGGTAQTVLEINPATGVTVNVFDFSPVINLGSTVTMVIQNMPALFQGFPDNVYVVGTTDGIFTLDVGTGVIVQIYTPALGELMDYSEATWSLSDVFVSCSLGAPTQSEYIIKVDANNIATDVAIPGFFGRIRCMGYDWGLDNIVIGDASPGPGNTCWKVLDAVTLTLYNPQPNVSFGVNRRADAIYMDFYGQRIFLAAEEIVSLEIFGGDYINTIAFPVPGQDNIRNFIPDWGSDLALWPIGGPYQGDVIGIMNSQNKPQVLYKNPDLKFYPVAYNIDDLEVRDKIKGAGYVVFPQVSSWAVFKNNNNMYGLAWSIGGGTIYLHTKNDAGAIVIQKIDRQSYSFSYSDVMSGGADSYIAGSKGPLPDCLTLDEKNGVIEKILDICSCKSCQGSADTVAPIVDDSLDLGDQGVLII